MAPPQPDVADRLDITVQTGGKVIAVSDLHLPPERSIVSGRCCELLARRLDAEPGPLTVVLAGDIVEMLAHPGVTARDILDAHDDLCHALAAVTDRGGEVVYTVGNHDGDLAWDLKTATAVRELTGARLCLAADLHLPGGELIRVEHGHQLDPYNCFHDARNPLDTPLGHHIVREVIPKIEWLGRDWLNGAHEMADPADFPSFLASRLVYRKLVRHLWWLLLVPIATFALVLPEIGRVGDRFKTTGRWLHDLEILGYGALLDIAIIALILAIVSRHAWTTISTLALSGRGYDQNSAARERADELIGQGYTAYLSGHTHHPELHAHGDGFYGNTGSCTSVVEAIDTMYGAPPVYLRAQQISWLEISCRSAAGAGSAEKHQNPDIERTVGPTSSWTSPGERANTGPGCLVELKSARVELPGATRLERFMSHARNPHSSAPACVAAWPTGPDWPTNDQLSLRDLKRLKKLRKLSTTECRTRSAR